jgi:uncharacterized protein
MIQVEEMNDKDIKILLARVGYGHLGLVRDTHPYVVPIHYAYDEPHIYIYTTEGKKTEIIEKNPEVCLQVEDVTDEKHWRSAIVTGDAVQLTDKEEISRAMDFIRATNPKLTPALSIHWMDDWIRANIQVVYRITPIMITGRATVL